MSTRTGLFFSPDYHNYKWYRPSSGFIVLGSGAMASGLTFDNTQLALINEYEGLERKEVWETQGNVLMSSGTVTYATYDA